MTLNLQDKDKKDLIRDANISIQKMWSIRTKNREVFKNFNGTKLARLSNIGVKMKKKRKKKVITKIGNKDVSRLTYSKSDLMFVVFSGHGSKLTQID